MTVGASLAASWRDYSDDYVTGTTTGEKRKDTLLIPGAMVLFPGFFWKEWDLRFDYRYLDNDSNDPTKSYKDHIVTAAVTKRFDPFRADTHARPLIAGTALPRVNLPHSTFARRAIAKAGDGEGILVVWSRGRSVDRPRVHARTRRSQPLQHHELRDRRRARGGEPRHCDLARLVPARSGPVPHGVAGRAAGGRPVSACAGSGPVRHLAAAAARRHGILCRGRRFFRIRTPAIAGAASAR